MKTVDAIARLDRAGNRNSKANAKLIEAAKVVSTWIAEKFQETTQIANEFHDILIWVSPSRTKSVEIRLPFDDDHSYVGACPENALAFAKAINQGLLKEVAKLLGEEDVDAINIEEVMALSVLGQASGLEGSHIYIRGGDRCVLCGSSSHTTPCEEHMKLAEKRTSIEVVSEREIRILVSGSQTFGSGGYSVSFQHVRGPKPQIVEGSQKTDNNGFVDSTTALVRFQPGTVVRVIEEDAIGKDGRVLMDKTYVGI